MNIAIFWWQVLVSSYATCYKDETNEFYFKNDICGDMSADLINFKLWDASTKDKTKIKVNIEYKNVRNLQAIIKGFKHK